MWLDLSVTTNVWRLNGLLPRRLRLCRHCRSLRTRVALAIVLLNVVFVVSLYRGGGSGRVPTPATGPPPPPSPHLVAGKTSLLDRLDTVRIRRDVGVTGKLEPCDGWTAGVPDASMEEHQRWQIVDSGLQDTFVFSAYFDPRTTPAAVKIIGISSGVTFEGAYSSPFKFCQLWFDGATVPRTTVAEYIIVPETHDRKYAASFHVCYLPVEGSSVPYAVSLVSERCQAPNNVLKVLDNDAERVPDVDFAVCVTPLNLRYDNVHRLTEFVEVHRLFGADRFVFYNYSTGSHVTAHLRRYAGDGVVSAVVPWRVPVAVDVWPPDPKEEPEIHYFAQLAALNDCLYRTMFRARFVVLADLDEVLVPRRRRHWRPMLEDATALWRRRFVSDDAAHTPDTVFPAAYLVQNVFFRTNWPDDRRADNDSNVRRLDLVTLLKTRREDRPYPHYARSKYVAWTRAAAMLAVHSVMQFVDDPQMMHVLVDERDALLHHYRQWDGDSLDLGSNVPTVDRRMHDFYADIVDRTATRHSQTDNS